jgi:hypothetical protein
VVLPIIFLIEKRRREDDLSAGMVGVWRNWDRGMPLMDSVAKKNIAQNYF